MEYHEQIKAEHKDAIGRKFLVKHVMGYRDYDQVDINLDPPAIVTIMPSEDGLDHAVGEWIDPYWDVVSDDPRLSGVRSLYVYGPSYNTATGERDDGGLKPA